MSFLICRVPVCPMRVEASHRSEQVSQLLFGEPGELLERANDFIRVRGLYDNYEGWCQVTQLTEAEPKIFAMNKTLAGGWVNKITIDNQLMYIPFGSSLDFLDNQQNVRLNVEYNGSTIHPGACKPTSQLVKQLTSTFLNTPYLWGGRSVFGIDCSGFTQLVFQCMNIPLMRDAYQQANQGELVGALQKSRCGDLAFFDNEAGRITHTGILLNSNTIVHASGKVRIDSIDNAGIINRETAMRTHNLRIIKRVIDGLLHP